MSLRFVAILLVGFSFVVQSPEAAGDRIRDDSPSNSPRSYQYAKLRPTAWRDAKITGGFWKPIRDRSRDFGVPEYLNKFEEHGYVDNFRYVAEQTASQHHGGPNNSEFVYKHLEAMGYYAAESDTITRLHKQLADTILAAQQPDGYLNTFFENPINKEKGRKRFQPRNRFEFYNFGHFTQAAIAHHHATGDRHLLDSAVRFADLIVDAFADPNDLPYDLYRGPVNQKYEHPNHELAMVELYRATGQTRYLDFVRQTLEEYEFFGPKFNEIWGHAVQETLLYAAATDLYLETGDRNLWQVIERLWSDMHDRKMYIIGGVGSTNHGEAYGKAFELPNANAYCETCAAISLVFWNHKMLLATGYPKYADEMERSLYNNVLSGISLAGTEYFYPNPLRFDPKRPGRSGTRSGWFGCSCCPPNVHRLLASLNQYIYTCDDSGIQINLFVDSEMKHTLPDGTVVRLTQTTEYPWNEHVALALNLDSPSRFVLSLRSPGWCEGATAFVNGRAVTTGDHVGQYLTIDRIWEDKDVVNLCVPLEPCVVLGDQRVKDQVGRLAIMRGPVVYCLEAHDNQAVGLDQIVVPKDVDLTATHEPDLLGGVVTLSGMAKAVRHGDEPKEVLIKAIPYYAWANRGAGWMEVWLPHDPAVLPKPKPPTIASTSRVTASFWNKGQANLALEAVNDQETPSSSDDRSVLWFHWWPHRGGTEWIQYDLAKPAKVAGVEVYWFDDTGRGNCRVPASWRLVYRTAHEWKPVANADDYGVAKDCLNRTSFDPVVTTGLRIETRLRDGFSSGVLEWRVVEAKDDAGVAKPERGNENGT